MAAVAAPYYAHPSTSSYPHQHHKVRGHRMCDTCGAVEQPGMQRFRLCGGCMVTQYCSPECQKSHWSQHKALCQHTASTVASAKGDASLAAASADENLVKNLRRFCSNNQTLLNWSVFQALNLKRVPSNIRNQALHIQLAPREHPHQNRRFVVASARLVPRSFVESCDPLVAQDILRREDRCRRAGGIGTAVILVQCGGMSQVMPVECDAPGKISWDMRDDWADIMGRYIETGRTDFQPITTTPMGVIFG